MNWSDYSPYFTEKEFRCKHTGKCEMDKEFMDILLAIRKEYGKSMKISSGYRDKTHPIEAAKQATGEHTTGRCCDVAVKGADAVRLMHIALKHGITRIGVQQKDDGRFLHLGLGKGKKFPNPSIWSY